MVNSWTYRRNVMEVITGENERKEKEWNLDQKCGSPAEPVADSDSFRNETFWGSGGHTSH